MANLHRVMSIAPVMDQTLRQLARDIDEHCGLDQETRELVFLRVALLRHNEYAWHNHAMEARGLGIEDPEITALEHWRSSERVHFDARERAILGYVDSVVNGTVSENAYRLLAEELAPSEIVGLTLLIGLAWTETALAAGLGLETEEPFVGWELFRGRRVATL
jgi:alkylhydroperoxidase family enzyme